MLMVEINFGCLSTMEIKRNKILQKIYIIKRGKHLEVDLTIIGNFCLENEKNKIKCGHILP
jgi:hypothetical protein